ncbi:hypothetical protein SAMN05421850_109101 [Lutimaribacter saemankumensis]|uniref:Uncharacterized protein n=1 Tax=Lutimaribacter saemankumensis TaxID=490829 RepID=A0A1G8RFJ7_9RHOB|nr:hypothetical protein SAMN05421850_109101 [Lutimaribacter saemankumensis]
MPTISTATPCQTVLTTFEMTPGTCQDLLDELKEAYEQFHIQAARLHFGWTACKRRPDAYCQLFPVGTARGFPGHAAQ